MGFDAAEPLIEQAEAKVPAPQGQLSRFLAGEGKVLRPMAFETRPEPVNVKFSRRKRGILPGGGFGEIGQADSEGQQKPVLIGCEEAGREPDLVQGAPEAVAQLRIIGLPGGGGEAGAGAAEDDPKAIGKKVFENISHGAPRLPALTG